MVQVIMPRSRKKDSLDTILKGLQIAGGVFNIKGAMEKSEALAAQRAEQSKLAEQQIAAGEFQAREREALARGELTPTRRFGMAEKGFIPAQATTPGAFEVGIDPATKQQVYFTKPQTQKGPSEFEIGRFQMAQRKEQRDIEKFERDKQKDIRARTTPYGIALTLTDANKLKEAYEEKQSFDKLVDEMIELREKHGGGQFLNRDDQSKATSASESALLKLKNIAKLGVLSTSDEKIINAIVPKDPLAYAFAGTGDDPIMAQLKSLKRRIDDDMQGKIKARLSTEDLLANEPQPPPNGALRIRDKQSGQVYKWDGTQYIPENGMASE